MSGRRSTTVVQMDDPTRVALEQWSHRRKTPVGLARRARAMLLLEQGYTSVRTAKYVGLAEYHIRKWAKRFCVYGTSGLREKPRPGRPPVFAPEAALHVVKLACERPDHVGSSLSQWDCPELARRLQADGVVSNISADTIERILRSHKLKPWRHHLWLSAKVPRDAHFAQMVRTLVELYTRPLAGEEMVVCADEKTNLQPRPRLAPTLPTRPDSPTRLEHEYKRAGAVHLFAAFDTRSGKVYAYTARHKRQEEFITLLNILNREIPSRVSHISLVLDNASIHKGKRVQAWLVAHPRFICHFLPTHCSWMNQVEQWFSILQRKRLRISDFADVDHLAGQLMTFVSQWNAHAHPFNWSTKSAAKVMAQCEAQPLMTLAA